MSIGINVVYRDPGQGERYWPYLTQRHLTGFVWPLAKALGLERVELLEALCVYESAEDVDALCKELVVLSAYLNDPQQDHLQYPDWEHVRSRTAELVTLLSEIQAEWQRVQRVEFF